MMNNSFLQISLALKWNELGTHKCSSSVFKKIIPFVFKLWGNWHKKQLQSYYCLASSPFHPFLGGSHFKDIAIGWW